MSEHSVSDKYTTQHVTHVRPWVTDKLFSFRTTRDAGFRFTPGQFARLGLQVGNEQVWRAYSMVSANYEDHLEFYSIVVPDGAFTGQLKTLKEGDPIWIEKTAYGFLTTAQFAGGKNLWLMSSGTGIAPFMSILMDIEVWEKFEKIILVHSVREATELAYQETILSLHQHEYFAELLAQEPQKLSYIPIVTRHAHPHCLSGRIQQHILDHTLENLANTRLEPEHSRVMLCGNPQMMKDLRSLLNTLGFKTTRRGVTGNLAIENYW